MEVVTGAMSTLLPKLADLIKDEYNLQKSVRDEITFLKTELEYMEVALRMVADAPIDQQPPNSLVKLWTRDVRELSYHLEDSIDAFLVHIEHAPTKAKKHSFRAFIERIMNLLRRGKIRHNIGVDFEEYKRRIKEVKERSDRYSKADNIGAKTSAPPSVDVHRLSALYTKETDLVGTQQKSDDLVKMLMEGDDEASKHHLKVLSIVGDGGLGKTTLARVVYDKLMMIGRFDCGAFVSVSHKPNIKNILGNILQGCGRRLKHDNTRDETQLINELRDWLRDKRYLIVIDDIWETSVWTIIQYAFDDNKLGSRVISTTRILSVAEQIGGIYKLQPLSHADSRKLFYFRIFGTKENCIPNELAEVSENILRKCAGVPLAIVIIASMLANGKENTHKYWSKVYQILGSGMKDSPDVIWDVRRILSISYYHLPPHLKSCMLYLCSYPEDDNISTKDLILKWVGEGFILKAQGKSCYEVGEEYINELMNRSLIQPSNINPDSNNAEYCHVHDMVLDLITHLSNEDGFLTRLDGRLPIYLPNTIRRLSLQTSSEKHVKLLSTVSFDHVRCLRLSFTSITEIPKEIRNLKFLQVLDVSGTKVYELPSTFVQLSKLMCLCFDYLMGIPDGFGDLKDLEVLIGSIVVEAPTMLHNFSGLTELRRVQLQFNEWDDSYDKLGMISFEYLQMMDISIRMVPSWISSLSTLTKLHIQVLTLREEDLQVLGSIPSLSDLSITVKEPKQCRDKKLVVINSHSFLCLKNFGLVCKTRMLVVFALGAMEKLERLVLTFGMKDTMEHLSHSGFGLENLSSLVSITVQMYCQKADPKEVNATKAAIQNAVDRNPNSPRLDMPVGKKVVLKVELHDNADKQRIQDCLGAHYEKLSIEAVDMKDSKVTVFTFMDPVDVVRVLRMSAILCAALPSV